MKTITMFETSWCPYCKQARNMIEELKKENKDFREIEIKIIDEEKQPDIAKQYDYYYVPTYYVEDKKLHEGVPNREIIENVLRAALS